MVEIAQTGNAEEGRGGVGMGQGCSRDAAGMGTGMGSGKRTLPAGESLCGTHWIYFTPSRDLILESHTLAQLQMEHSRQVVSRACKGAGESEWV